MEVPTYTDADYRAYLKDSKWTLERTNHLMELARQFDVRFIHMHDRWDAEKFPPRPSLEELKARYYGILGTLDKVRQMFHAKMHQGKLDYKFYTLNSIRNLSNISQPDFSL